MRFIHFMTLATIGLGSATAATAASPLTALQTTGFTVSTSTAVAPATADTFQIIKVNGRDKFRSHRFKRSNRQVRIKKRARHHQHAQRQRRENREYRRSDGDSKDLGKVIGVLGIAAILSNNF